VVDREVVVSRHEGEGWAYGLSGLLSPSFRTYTVGVLDPQCNLQEARGRGCCDGSGPASDDADACPPCAFTPNGLRFEGVGIATWSMRFFGSQRPATNGELTAWGGLVASNVLAGSVVNQSSRTVHDAWLIFRWDLVRLGELAPHSTNAFRLVLNPQNPNKGILCPHCHTYHGSYDPFEKHGCTPAPGEELKELAKTANLPVQYMPLALGLDTAPEPLLHVDGILPLRRDARRLLAAPVEIRWNRPVVVPFGFSFGQRMDRYDGNDARGKDEAIEQEFERELARVDWEYVPYEFRLRDLRHSMPALQTKPAPGNTDAPALDPDPEASEDSADTVDFIQFFFLPPAVGKVADTGRVTVRWDRGEPDPEQPARQAMLSVLDWNRGEWGELARARAGDRLLTLTNTAACILRPYPVVALKTSWLPEKKRTGQSKQRYGNGQLGLDVMFEERSNERAP